MHGKDTKPGKHSGLPTEGSQAEARPTRAEFQLIYCQAAAAALLPFLLFCANVRKIVFARKINRYKMAFHLRTMMSNICTYTRTLIIDVKLERNCSRPTDMAPLGQIQKHRSPDPQGSVG
jgi:hypothetical protein